VQFPGLEIPPLPELADRLAPVAELTAEAVGDPQLPLLPAGVLLAPAPWEPAEASPTASNGP
jgi:hypothetical protein